MTVVMMSVSTDIVHAMAMSVSTDAVLVMSLLFLCHLHYHMVRSVIISVTIFFFLFFSSLFFSLFFCSLVRVRNGRTGWTTAVRTSSDKGERK